MKRAAPICRQSILLLGIAAILGALARPVVADSLLKDGDVVAICGDSITEQKQYSVFIEAYLLACKPAQNLRAVQIGWSGEQAPGFLNRISSDVLPFKPTVATMFYGMNDGGYAAMNPQTGTKYHDALKAAVEALKAGGVRTVLVGSPGCVDSVTYAKRPGGDARLYNETLAELTSIAKEVAGQTHSPFEDVHTLMFNTMAKAKGKYGEKFAFVGNDGVHPGAAGHLVIAYAFLKGLGCSGDLGTITLDLNGDPHDNSGTPGHRVLRRADNSNTVEIESTRYPFCFTGDATSSDSEKSMLPFIPFVDELDRLMLVVKNAGTGKLRVTWNNQVKDFSSEQLVKGINLVAEYPESPFAEAFERVKKAVRAQQEFESTLTKSLLHSVPDEKQKMPEATEQIDALMQAALRHDRLLTEAAANEANKPVRHTIKIEPVP